MKITSINPLIVTNDIESIIKFFEAIGFEKHHQKKGISDQDITGVRMKNADGFFIGLHFQRNTAYKERRLVGWY